MYFTLDQPHLKEKYWAQLLKLRTEVFINEQKLVNFEVEDRFDCTSTQIIATNGSQIIGHCRLRQLENNNYKIERVCVCREFRNSGIGSKLIHFAEQQLIDQGVFNVCLFAQARMKDFYLELGYSIVSKKFEHHSVPHIKMRKILRSEQHEKG